MSLDQIKPQGYVYEPCVAFDTETHLMATCNLIPKLICMAISNGDVNDVQSTADADVEALCNNINYLMDVFERPGEKIVAANAAFDLAVLCRYIPEALPHVFNLLEKGLIEDIFIREKLIHLSTHGDLEYMTIENATGESTTIKLEWGLGALSKRYLGKNRQTDKEESDAWRKFYSQLEGQPVSTWPKEAVQYVAEDAHDTWQIREVQERERVNIWNAIGRDPFAVQGFRVMASFSLHLMSAWGMCIDPVQKKKITDMLAEELKPEKMKLMVAAGILRPGEAPRPKKGTNPDGTPKMTKGTDESVNKKVLQAYVEAFCARKGLEVSKTAPTEKFPEGQTQTCSEFFEEHQGADPVFQEYYNRQVLQKLVTTEIPRMSNPDGTDAPVVHPSFDVMKKTGRTSSFASKLYASFNCQNVDPRVRECFIPRPGHLFFSIDYNQMELGTAAQKCFDLFGHSVLMDKINAGIDVHTYLGAQLAYNLNEDFRRAVESQCVGVEISADVIYEAFAKCKKHESEEVRKFFGHYRKFAKPTGLGYPGGLGPKTFVTYAKATYGIEVDLPMAEKLRDIWRATFPEFVPYFKWITSSCKDLVDVDKYAYTSPMGMYRAGADYCAAANGAALQTPSAEGAILSVISIVRACFDTSMSSILCDDAKGPVVRPTAFIHDEVLGEIRDDDQSLAGKKLRHARLNEMARLMVAGMTVITPNVKARANPVLMKCWNKEAEPVFVDGVLEVWEPKPKK